MKILIIGNGAREHALAWKAAQSPHVEKVFVAPGNAGTALESRVENVAIAATDVNALADFAKRADIGLTIVGPEAPLAVGIVDLFNSLQLPCFGPSQLAARLESSKTFAKDFMQRHHIPTASYANFSDLAAAIAYIKQKSMPIVIKADGLAAGKGVVIAKSQEEAIATVTQMLQGRLGQASQSVVIEEYLQGEEVSFIVITDGESVLPLATSQDHKTRDNGDRGPNTGGMGAYSPAPIVTDMLEQQILETIIKPTLNGLKKEGCPYVGFLYAGLMITPQNQIKVLEYNCRLGDPEAQPILIRLRSDLIELCKAALNQQLNKMILSWDPRPALTVVLASQGYPFEYQKGDIIYGLQYIDLPHQKVFHGGTEHKNGHIVTCGGRVLCATALGDTIGQAQTAAYELAKKITWDHQYYRTDIGYRAINRD
jgi:phosphoribosylamine---glycine ligase